MRLINKANRYMMRLLGNQYIDDTKEYAPHKYLIRDENRLYNVLTNEAVLVEDWEADREELIRRWFYTPPDFDVCSAAYLSNSRMLSISEGPVSSKGLYVIFMTTACNAACEYCFELGSKVITMAEDTAEDIAEYISKHSNPDVAVRVRWFGGEPLVNKKCISIIASELNRLGVKFNSEMLTNGDLFNEVTDDEIKLWNLQNVQFTIDTVGEKYDAIKHLPAGAYERIKKTTERLGALGIHISIRVHLDPDRGVDEARKVVDEFKGYDNVGIYTRLLYKSVTKKDYEDLLELEDYIVSTGKMRHNFKQFGSPRHCMADSSGTACITPEGLLTPCEHYAYGVTYGSIYKKAVDGGMLKEWKRRTKDAKKCGDCVFFPTCKLLKNCPAEGSCEEGYNFYLTETIKRAMRERTL